MSAATLIAPATPVATATAAMLGTVDATGENKLNGRGKRTSCRYAVTMIGAFRHSTGVWKVGRVGPLTAHPRTARAIAANGKDKIKKGSFSTNSRFKVDGRAKSGTRHLPATSGKSGLDRGVNRSLVLHGHDRRRSGQISKRTKSQGSIVIVSWAIKLQVRQHSTNSALVRDG